MLSANKLLCGRAPKDQMISAGWSAYCATCREEAQKEQTCVRVWKEGNEEEPEGRREEEPEGGGGIA